MALLTCTFSYKVCLFPPQRWEPSKVMKAVFVKRKDVGLCKDNLIITTEKAISLMSLN